MATRPKPGLNLLASLVSIAVAAVVTLLLWPGDQFAVTISAQIAGVGGWFLMDAIQYRRIERTEGAS